LPKAKITYMKTNQKGQKGIMKGYCHSSYVTFEFAEYYLNISSHKIKLYIVN
jgi:hypothetical protein